MIQRQKKQVQIKEIRTVGQASMLEKLAAMNATKTELRQYNLAIIITVNKIHSSAGRV